MLVGTELVFLCQFFEKKFFCIDPQHCRLVTWSQSKIESAGYIFRSLVYFFQFLFLSLFKFLQNVICRTVFPKFACILIYVKKFTNQTIVSRGDWLGNPANPKVEINCVVGYVGISLTVRNPLVFCSQIMTE